MDVFEKVNKAFAGWYESLFGDGMDDLRPKDILRQIITAMEDNRKEGLDSRIYVPNKYILEICFDNDEEREYLLAFLEKNEFESALRKYMTQNKYFMRGPLDFTLEEIPCDDEESKQDKFRVRCKWELQSPEKASDAPYIIAELAESPQSMQGDSEDYEERTVAAVDFDDACTIAPPVLDIKHVDGTENQYFLTKSVAKIGRSRHADNDLFIEKDGMVSKSHARIVQENGAFRIVDMDSTNGVWVNGERVTSRVLKTGDVIRLGGTTMIFSDSTARDLPRQAMEGNASVRPRLMIRRSDTFVEEFRLPSETIIGRALTSDIRFEDGSVSQKHARVFSSDGTIFFIDDLGSADGTFVNGQLVSANSPVKLNPGDAIQIGKMELKYEVD